MLSMSRLVAVAATVLSFLSVSLSRRLSEDERVKLWKQNNQWPPVWQPETDGKLNIHGALDSGNSAFLSLQRIDRNFFLREHFLRTVLQMWAEICGTSLAKISFISSYYNLASLSPLNIVRRHQVSVRGKRG